MHESRPLAAHQRDELEQPERVVDGMQRAAHLAQRDEPRAGVAGRVAQRPVAVRGDDHVVALGERRQQLRHVGLGAARLRERYEDEDLRHPASVPRREPIATR